MKKTTASPVALLCADLHLSDKPPLCRQEEPDWYAFQQDVLSTVCDLSRQHKVPIVFAGDFFDKPRVSPQLEGMAIRTLQTSHAPWDAIPGQHDLFGHNLENVDVGSFGVLVAAGVLQWVQGSFPVFTGNSAYPIQFGEDICSHKNPYVTILITHRLAWMKEPYPGAPIDGNVKAILSATKAKLVVTGDNHHPFDYKAPNGQQIINCGTMMRRKADEEDIIPSVVLLYDDLSTKRIPICTPDTEHFTRPFVPLGKQGDTNELEAFVQTLISNDGAIAELSFDHVLERVAAERKTSKQIISLIKEVQHAE